MSNEIAARFHSYSETSRDQTPSEFAAFSPHLFGHFNNPAGPNRADYFLGIAPCKCLPNVPANEDDKDMKKIYIESLVAISCFASLFTSSANADLRGKWEGILHAENSATGETGDFHKAVTLQTFADQNGENRRIYLTLNRHDLTIYLGLLASGEVMSGSQTVGHYDGTDFEISIPYVKETLQVELKEDASDGSAQIRIETSWPDFLGEIQTDTLTGKLKRSDSAAP